MIATYIFILAVLMLLIALATFVLVARIVKRAGYSPYWALVSLVPGVNLIFLYVFAFALWPLLEASAVREVDLADDEFLTLDGPKEPYIPKD